MENLEKESIWKGTEFWTDELEKAGVKNQLKFFNDVVTEQRPPVSDSGWEKPVLIDVKLDGKLCDVYHTDHNKGDSRHRIFIYIKE